MAAREIFIEETGYEEPSNPMLHAEWTLTFYDWLEKQVGNWQKTKGNPESFENTTLKDFLKMMENLDRLSSVCFYSDGSGDVVNNENNSELCFDNLEELGELLKPKFSFGDKVTHEGRHGDYIFLRYFLENKDLATVSDGNKEYTFDVKNLIKLEP